LLWLEEEGKGINKSYIDKKRALKRTESTLPIFNAEDIEEGVEGYEAERSFLLSQKRLEKRFGQSPIFIASTFMEQGGIPASTNPASLLQEAIHVISCGYEDKTEWGKEIGWIYGSVTEDILTGFKMHARGWISIYCMPPRPAFKGSAPINLSDRLNQVLRWALGSIEILLSRHCPIWYGYKGRLKLLERIAYINTIVYPITSIPLIAYCVLPAICLLTGKFIIPEISNYAGMWFILLFASIFATGILELKWSGIGIEDWWRNEQFWVIGGTSAHLFAVFKDSSRCSPASTPTSPSPQGIGRRRRLCRALRLQMDEPSCPAHHRPRHKHGGHRRRRVLCHQQWVPVLGSSLWEALLLLLGHRPSLSFPQGSAGPAEQDAHHCHRLVDPSRFHILPPLGADRSFHFFFSEGGGCGAVWNQLLILWFTWR
ncbi:hypothetical protein HPP92_027352, partial [Vanilla planifolia]